MIGLLPVAAAMIAGTVMSKQKSEADKAAKAEEEARKIELHEQEGYAAKGNHQLLQSMYDQGMYPHTPEPLRNRYLARAGGYANQQITNDAEGAMKAGFRPFDPQNQLGQALTMLQQGQGGAPPPMSQPGAPRGMAQAGTSNTVPVGQPTQPMDMASMMQGMPAGTPGKVAAQGDGMPKVGGAPWAYTTDFTKPGSSSHPLAPPTALGDGGQRMLKNDDQFTPMRDPNAPQQFDEQGKPLAPQPQSDLIPQPIRDQPIVMAQKKQYGPQAGQPTPMALKFPAGVRPGKAGIEGPLGTVPGKGEEMQNSTAVSQDIVAQAKSMGMHPDLLDQEFAKQIARSNGQYPAFDETVRKSYRTEYFQSVAQQKQQALMAAGVPEPQAQQQAARLAADSMGGWHPEGTSSLIQYTPEERHRNTIGQATKQVVMQARAAMDASRPGEPATIQPGLFAKYVDDALGTDATPQERDAILNDVTNMAATTFRQKLAAIPGITGAQASIMAMQAASGIAGHTPKEWLPQIMANAQAFGITDPEIAKRVATGEIDLLKPGSLQEGITRINAEQLEGKIREKGMERQFAVAQTPEGVEATKQSMLPQSTQVAGPGGAAPAPSPGQIDRDIKLQQTMAETKGKEEIQKQYRVAPQKEIDNVRALDDMYVKGTRLLQLGKGDPTKGTAGLIEKYGNYPGTFFDLMNQVKSGTGTMEPELKEYVNTLSGLFNIEKKEFTGTATSLNERKDLVAWIPDKTTNVRDALQSVAHLVKTVTSDLDRDTKHIAANFPGTDLSSLKYNQIQERRLARKQQDGGTKSANALPPLGNEIIGKTDEGRPIVRNSDGSVSTERTITEQIDGKWMNIPSMFGGKEVSPDEAVDIIRRNKGVDPETGRKLPTYNTVDEAVKEAERRSREDLGKYGNGNGAVKNNVHVSPPPPPPQPSQPAAKADLGKPPIADTAKSYKERYPSEAVPKFGPGSTKAASALVPKDVVINDRDKSDLATAMQKYGRGQLDDRQLELEVAKTLARAGRGKLEGKQLNAAVTAWTEVLRRGAKSRKEFARGQ